MVACPQSFPRERGCWRMDFGVGYIPLLAIGNATVWILWL